MAFILFLLLFVLISTCVLLSLGNIIYSYAYLADMPATRRAPRWENTLYYIIVAYPPISLVVMALAGNYILADAVVDTVTETQAMLVFCIGHFILSVLAVSVARYLQQLHKAHVIFIITSVLAGGGYMYAAMFGVIELAKN